VSYEDVRLNSADGTEARPIRSQPIICQPIWSQPGVSSPARFPRWNSPGGSGCSPLRTRFFLRSWLTKSVLCGSQVCSATAYVCLVFHSIGTQVSLGSNEEQFP
jgi:hypothetical protein